MKNKLLYIFSPIILGLLLLGNISYGASVLQVFQGGTGRTTFTAGECLKGNGTGGITSGACSSGSLNSVIAGTGISIDNTDPANPIVTNSSPNATHTGDATGATALTLATVNSNVGSFTNGSFTVNAKGLITAASSGATPEVPLTFSTGLTRTINTVTVNTSQNISTLSNLTSNGFVKTSGGGGTLSVDTNTYLTSVGTGVANELTYWSGTNTLGSLATATYPSLTELSYVKGLTSSVQTQLGNKQATITFGTGVQTALGVNIGSAGAPVLFNGALGTPSSGTLTNATGLPAAAVLAGTFGTGAYTMDTSLTVPILNGSSAANGDITINGTSNATKTSSYVILQATGGSVGIGTTTPAMTFHIATSNNKTTVANNFISFISTNEALASGPFGLRTNITGAASLTNRYVSLQTTDYNTADGGNLVLQTGGGNVGIGTTAPAAALELASGGLYVSNYGSGVSVPGGGSIGMYLRGATSTSPFGFSAAGTGNISATAPLFYYSWVGSSATKLGFSSYDASAVKDYIAFDYATGNFEVKAPAIEATSSTTIGTTTLADKFGNAYLTNGADLYPDNDVYGLWDRFINYGFTPDEHWGQNADELTWTGWATYTGFVTPASISTTLSSYSVAHNSGVKSAFRYRSAATGADIWLRSRASVTFLNTGGLMIDDGTDTGDGNGANNFYRVYIKQTALAGAYQVFEEYRTGGGAVTTNTGPTIAYGQFSGIGIRTQGTRWTAWTAAPTTFGESQSAVQFTGGSPSFTWTPARVGLYSKFSATDFGRRAVWDWYDESTS